MSHRLPALSAALLLLAAACSVETTPEDDDVTAIQDALELDDGGMTMDAEAPAFGDEEQFTAIDDFAEVADATPVEVAAGLDRYRVVLIWGSLARGETPASPTDWSGDLSLDQGAMRVTRTLVFDSQDGLLPREDAQTVSFVSHTLPHVDGLALDLVAPPGASLSFTTAPLTATIRLADLAAAGRGNKMVDQGVGVMFAGFQVDDTCNSGFALGHWQDVTPELGRFRGRVLDASGATEGHVRGIYGDSQRFGDDVFFGKYIALDGEARGLLGGTYGAGDVVGRWGTNNGGKGALKGHYFSGAVDGDGQGFWLGRWRATCE